MREMRYGEAACIMSQLANDEKRIVGQLYHCHTSTPSNNSMLPHLHTHPLAHLHTSTSSIITLPHFQNNSCFHTFAYPLPHFHTSTSSIITHFSSIFYLIHFHAITYLRLSPCPYSVHTLSTIYHLIQENPGIKPCGIR